MYPLFQIDPLRLSSGGLLLLLSIMIGGWLVAGVARSRGGTQLARQADSCFYPVLIGALIGARLWYGLFNLDVYGRNPGLFLAPRVSDFAWPGALLGGMLAGYMWCRRNGFDALKLADSAALILPLVQAIASIGLLLSGEAFGAPASLPWGVPLFGATRHPTQLYFTLAALGSLLLVWRLARRPLPRVAQEFGRRFTAAGVIDYAEDVFCLTIGELRATAEALPHAAQQELVAQRKADLTRFSTVAAPPVLGTLPAGAPPDDPFGRAIGRFFGGPPQPSSDPHTLRGNTGSPGVVRGVAKVVRSLREAAKLTKGDILVAETTAPPWTPLFATAAGIVTDTGGILSHCAIVAREYHLLDYYGGVSAGGWQAGRPIRAADAHAWRRGRVWARIAGSSMRD